MTYDHFKTLWGKAEQDSRGNGELSIADWSAMCEQLDAISEKLGIERVEENAPITHPTHLAFVAGAQWGFARRISLANAAITNLHPK
jgi:sugar phosphate isomerase/epimerase